MPVIDAQGCPIHVEIEGRDDAPVLMLSNSLGTNLHMWDAQVPEFAKHYRLVRYDRRGHGKSGVSKGPYTMELLGRDALAVLDALKIEKANWCGLSMGGMEGQWLGANAPDRFSKLILANTAAYYPDKAPWNDRLKLIRENGLKVIVKGTMERWFTTPFLDSHPDEIARMTQMLLSTPLDGYLACGEAVRDMDHRALLPKVKVPTLVIAGSNDPATSPQMGEVLRDNIPGAKFTLLEAAHISNIEQPKAFTDAVLAFLR